MDLTPEVLKADIMRDIYLEADAKPAKVPPVPTPKQIGGLTNLGKTFIWSEGELEEKRKYAEAQMVQKYGGEIYGGSAQLGKWSRIESKDRKIKVYDPIKWNHAISAISDTARLEVSDFSGFFDSVTSSGTNLSLKCVQTGIRYRCVFNEVEYGRRYTDFGETLLLPEGSSLVLTGGGRKLTFLPIVSPCSPVRGFHVSLTNDFLGHGERVKNGFLLFSPSVGRDLSEEAVDSKRSEDACRLNGVVFTQSLTID